LYHGLIPDTRVGHTFGHEFVGVVEQVGAEVQKVKTGDRVLVPFNIFCGECYFCQKGFYSNCHNVNPNATAVGGIYGYSHTTGGYDGGQAQYVRVPFADRGAYPIPDDIEEDDAVLCRTPIRPATRLRKWQASSAVTRWWCSARDLSACLRPKAPSSWAPGAYSSSTNTTTSSSSRNASHNAKP